MRIRDIQLFVRMMVASIAILVSVPGTGLGHVLYLCSMTGQLGAKCCCDHEVQASNADGTSLSMTPCCEVVNGEQRLNPARVQSVSPKLAILQFIPPAYPQSRPERVTVSTGLVALQASRGPPFDTGSAIYIRHCSYLI
jgi:hypothetical protein